MKKATDVFTYVKEPIGKLRLHSQKVFDRYSALFRSIKKLAHPLEKQEHEKEKT